MERISNDANNHVGGIFVRPTLRRPASKKIIAIDQSSTKTYAKTNMAQKLWCDEFKDVIAPMITANAMSTNTV